MFASGAALFRRRASSAMRRCSVSDAPSWPARFSSSATASERTGPPPIRVSLTESAGRGVFATREIAAGELIHSANPLVVHPSLSLLDKVCYCCLGRLHEAPSPLGSSAAEENDSSKTAASYFCSESCREQSKVFFEIERRLDWSSFHQYCGLKRLKYPLMVKRLACMVISGAASIDSLDILQPASLHPEILAEMDEEFQLLEDTFQSGQFKNDMTFLTKEWYINALARIRINAFRIELVARSYEEMLSSAVAFIAVDAAVGNAVYMLPSFYNHDCDPNTHTIWIDNANAKLKALRHIEEGEELRICYIDTSMGFEARQKILGEGFGFQCRCLRCLSHE
ncbi:histone-lysine N-methyltransferase ATXR4-like [Zingiber officinale]|uniref:histone-lysine N-methyltransferase ATXR4-like n=1 Tax=Zingiber officinale TaxID=94328 RepID=UPI001C4BB06A|nr:histone-lysine N-methyltransferase ATXR4-like [Zingiber officinale]